MCWDSERTTKLRIGQRFGDVAVDCNHRDDAKGDRNQVWKDERIARKNPFEMEKHF